MEKLAKNIVLGRGVFEVDGIQIGLTRDGGNFSVEYQNRPIAADGDRGNVKGRIIRDGATAKIQISHLEILTAIEKLHAGIIVEESETHTIIRGTGKIDDENDYHTVRFIGETKDGREVAITITNAINLENISLDLKDKNEILDSITFTASYEENEDSTDENWEIRYAK